MLLIPVAQVWAALSPKVKMAYGKKYKPVVANEIEKELAFYHAENFDLDRPWDNFKNKLPK